jgi:hypothetical protein
MGGPPGLTSQGRMALLASSGRSGMDSEVGLGDFFGGDLPKKFGILLALLALSRLGVYIPTGAVSPPIAPIIENIAWPCMISSRH